MNHRFIVPLLSVCFGFFFGYLFGFFNPQDEKKHLYVLSQEGYFPPKLLDEFSKESGVILKLEQVQDVKDQVDRLKDYRRFDVVQFRGSQSHFFSSDLLASLDSWRGKSKNFSKVSVDFQKLAQHKNSAHFLPLTWYVVGRLGSTLQESFPSSVALDRLDSLRFLIKGDFLNVLWLKDSNQSALQEGLLSLRKKFDFFEPLEFSNEELLKNGQLISTNGILGWLDYQKWAPKNWRFSLFSKGSYLETEVLAIPMASSRKKEAIEFIDFLLTKSSSLALAKHNLAASTNLDLNSDGEVNRVLKASFIRDLPLRHLKPYVESFSATPHLWPMNYSQFLGKKSNYGQ